MPKPTSLRLAVVFAGVACLGSGVAAPAASAPHPPQMLTQHDEDVLMISVDSGTSAAAPVTAVSAEAATAAAAAYLGRTDAPSQVVHGLASRTASDAPSTVWIVLYPGGDAVGGTPYGVAVTPMVVDYTGVVVDDTTAEILRAFGVGH